jgi:protein-L-isoaspartate(D-aspartate) O-methyltransferase
MSWRRIASAFSGRSRAGPVGPATEPMRPTTGPMRPTDGPMDGTRDSRAAGEAGTQASALAGGETGDPPGDAADDPWREARARMVERQLRPRGITDEQLLRAFQAVPRHRFVASDDPYGDRALGIGEGQTISQPYVVAEMTRLARPAGGWREARVLEIGTGSGYSAAILAALGASVTTVERFPGLAAEAAERIKAAGYGDVRVVVGDGTLGWPAGAPYDAIVVTAAGPSVPGPLREQLSPDGGRLVMPVGDLEQQDLVVVERRGDDYAERRTEPVVFVPLIGEHGFRG